MSILASAQPGSQGFDSDIKLSIASATALRTAGFAFGIRYLSRTTPRNAGDLSPGEVEAILGAGIMLGAVQHCPLPGWSPSAAIGMEYGVAAAANAAYATLPQGMHLWLDLEGVASYATAAEVIAYVNAWAAPVSAAGYLPGLYVGANQPLNSSDLYWRLKVKSYWRSASNVPDVDYRGYCMAQALAPSPIDGIDLDRDVAMVDSFGGLPIMAAAG